MILDSEPPPRQGLSDDPSARTTATCTSGRCGEFGAFRRIALPLAAPVVALVGFFSFVQNWNNFFLPYVMLPGSGQYPMQVGLTQMLASTPTFNPVVGANAAVSPTQLALAALLSVAPVLVIFLVAQRFLVTGLTAGGTKG